MHAALAGVCLVAVGIVLEGCGGGSSTCTNSQPDLVSQSMVGKVTGSSTATIKKIAKTQDINADITEKMDFEKFNYASSGSMPVTTKLPNGTALDMKVEFKTVFVASQKQSVEWHKITDNKAGTVTVNCTKKTFKNMPDPARLKSEFAMIKRIMQQKATCGGNDGTDDSWNVAQNYDGPVPAIPGVPVPAGTTVDVTLSLKLEMDKDYLIHGAGVNMQMSGSMSNMTMEVTDNSNLKVSDSKAGGPSDADLDVSSWGDCTPAAAGDADVDTLFEHQDANMKNHMMFQNHIIAAIKAGLKSQKSTVVV